VSKVTAFLRSPFGWVLLAAVVAGALVVGALGDRGPRTQGERVDAVAKTVKCPTCRSESVYESRSAAAQNLRNEIARQVSAGRTDDEVRAYIAERFGEGLLLTPGTSGVPALVWVLPVVAVVLAGGGLALAFRRWRDQDAADARAVTDDDRALVAAALADEHDRP
jgi:cytochrome c-type biogenesis protein CcmH